MKTKSVVLIAILMAVAVFTWAKGADEGSVLEEAPAIEFLTTAYHDSPEEVRQAWVEEFKRLTGVDVILRTVSSKDAGEAMLTQFVAGELPDVVKYGGQGMSALARQGFVLPLNTYIKGSPMQELEETYPTAFAAHSVGDEVYGIPEIVGAKRSLWMRTDVLESLGLAMPTTLDELVDVLRVIRDEYTNPDGSRMTSPYITKTYHTGYISGISNYFDVQMDPVIRRPGDRMYREGWDSSQFQDYAEFVKKLYDEGLIDPEHVLPQKASGTRSKFFSGQGAFLMMHAHLYQGLIVGLQENFPDAEVEMVPPIVNPQGGVLGLAVVPGYRPYAITSAAEDPEFIWESFIEPIYFDPDVSMLMYRGIAGIDYRVENGVMVDNSDVSGQSMGQRSPLNPNIVFPLQMGNLLQHGVELETQFDSWFSDNERYVAAEVPNVDVPEYNTIKGDMKDKMAELFWKYVLGEISFSELTEQYEAYKVEIGFSGILADINAAE